MAALTHAMAERGLFPHEGTSIASLAVVAEPHSAHSGPYLCRGPDGGMGKQGSTLPLGLWRLEHTE